MWLNAQRNDFTFIKGRFFLSEGRKHILIQSVSRGIFQDSPWNIDLRDDLKDFKTAYYFVVPNKAKNT